MSRWPPVLIALMLQVAALILVVASIKTFSLVVPTWMLFLIVAMLATLLTVRSDLPRWWLPIQFAFIPLLAIGQGLSLPSWGYLLAFVLLSLVFWSTYRSQVPLYLSSSQAHAALIRLLPQDKGVEFVDIGAGLGGVVLALAKARPDGEFTALENAPLPALFAWLRLRGKANCRCRRADFWQENFSQYDVVYAYLSPVPMVRLWEKVKSEMRPGALLVSNTFDIPGQEPDQKVEINNSCLFIWRI